MVVSTSLSPTSSDPALLKLSLRISAGSIAYPTRNSSTQAFATRPGVCASSGSLSGVRPSALKNASIAAAARARSIIAASVLPEQLGRTLDCRRCDHLATCAALGELGVRTHPADPQHLHHRAELA